MLVQKKKIKTISRNVNIYSNKGSQEGLQQAINLHVIYMREWLLLGKNTPKENTESGGWTLFKSDRPCKYIFLRLELMNINRYSATNLNMIFLLSILTNLRFSIAILKYA